MWKNWVILILGIILMIIPFAGIPLSFLKLTYFIIGLLITLLAYWAARDLHLISLLLDDLPTENPKDHSFLDRSLDEIVETGESNPTEQNVKVQTEGSS